MKKLILLLTLISLQHVFAQTPNVQTRKATNVSSSESTPGSSDITIWATLRGIVNANNTNCSVSFEYGNTTSYGNTISANPATVTGSTDIAVSASIGINYTYNGSQERLIHYRLKVTNENGTYYSRDFSAIPIDPIRNIGTIASCSDSPTMANFDIENRNSFEITIYYDAGPGNSGTVTLGSFATQQIFVPKGSVCAFKYGDANNHFRQVLTNDQLCTHTPLARQNVWMTATGAIAPDKLMFKIQNGNNYAVDLNLTNNTANYPYTIATNSVAFLVADKTQTEISAAGETFALSETSNYTYEGMGWLTVTSLSTTVTTANFELYNRDDAEHTFVLRNAGGIENSYTLAPYESRTITLANENWDVFTNVRDYTILYAHIYTGPAFGNTAYVYNGMIKIATATPAPKIPLTPYLTSITQNSLTSFTSYGEISGNPAQSEVVEYHFIYGTDPNNLNLSTPTQQITIPAGQDANVNAAINGLTTDNLYYCKLVVGSNQSNRREILLTNLPKTNMKLHLRADLNTTSSSSQVSIWGDVSGNGNNAVQENSSNQPLLVENSINGKTVLRYNGTSSKMLLPTSTALGMQNNSYEMFITAKSSSSNVQFLLAGGANELFEYHLNGTSGARFIPTTSSFLDHGTTGNYSDDKAHVFSARASASGGAVRVDGIDGGTSANNLLSSNSGNLILGARSNGTYYFNGAIAEVIIYNSVLSPEDRNTVEQYLANRYNITSGVLPVELVSFTAKYAEGKVLLSWQTATEVNNYGFNIERAFAETKHSASLRWETIAFVNGHGNSNSPKNYSFTDAKPTSGKVHYRLKQIDFDGKYEYSNAVEVNIETPKEFKLSQNFPNPFNPTTTIKFSIPGNAETPYMTSLRVFDMLGREVATLVNEQKAPGNYEVKFDGSKLTSGIYCYRLTVGNKAEIKKMLYLK
jgi:hypothetical protein